MHQHKTKAQEKLRLCVAPHQLHTERELHLIRAAEWIVLGGSHLHVQLKWTERQSHLKTHKELPSSSRRSPCLPRDFPLATAKPLATVDLNGRHFPRGVTIGHRTSVQWRVWWHGLLHLQTVTLYVSFVSFSLFSFLFFWDYNCNVTPLAFFPSNPPTSLLLSL